MNVGLNVLEYLFDFHCSLWPGVLKIYFEVGPQVIIDPVNLVQIHPQLSGLEHKQINMWTIRKT